MSVEGFFCQDAIKEIVTLKVLLGTLKHFSKCLIYINGVTGFILLMYLGMFSWLGVPKLLYPTTIKITIFLVPLVLDTPVPGLKGGELSIQKLQKGQDGL